MKNTQILTLFKFDGYIVKNRIRMLTFVIGVKCKVVLIKLTEHGSVFFSALIANDRKRNLDCLIVRIILDISLKIEEILIAHYSESYAEK